MTISGVGNGTTNLPIRKLKLNQYNIGTGSQATVPVRYPLLSARNPIHSYSHA